jgi:hypothetical protein
MQMAELNVESLTAGKKSDTINIESYPLTVHVVANPLIR